MSKNKKVPNAERIGGWLASTGYLLPATEKQLANFEKMFDQIDYGLKGNEIDPKKITGDNRQKRTIKFTFSDKEAYSIAAFLPSNNLLHFTLPPFIDPKEEVE